MMTKTTKALFQGIHPNNVERDMTDHRKMAARKRDRHNTSKPPRTRPGKSFPGGKHMRKALANLSARQNNKPQEGNKPGSMKASQAIA